MAAKRTRRRRLNFEILDPRIVLSVDPVFHDKYYVTSQLDSGLDTLREAILWANSNPGPDQIIFDFKADTPRVINLETDLPAITDTVTIIADPGFGTTFGFPHPTVELHRINSDPDPQGIGLWIRADDCRIAGLSITGFSHGIVVQDADAATIRACYLGVSLDGETAPGGMYHGLRLVNSADNTLTECVIAGASRESIYVEGAGCENNLFQGNRIGTNASGRAALDNLSAGIHLAIGAHDNTIEGNLISGSRGVGIVISDVYGVASHDNIVRGNTIGLDVNDDALGNGNLGIFIINAYDNTIEDNLIAGNGSAGISVDGAGSTGNVIRDNTIGKDGFGDDDIGNAGDGIALNAAKDNSVLDNLIVFNGGHGVALRHGASGNLIAGNDIGLNGETIAANGGAGVALHGASNNTIGGTGGVDGNVISGNAFSGIEIIAQVEGDTTGNVVLGNFIGTNRSGLTGYANRGDGVLIANASGNTVGGTTWTTEPPPPFTTGAGTARNIISGNAGFGVRITGDGAVANRVLGNYIGIDRHGDTPLANGADGVVITQRASGNTIGGASAAARNVIGGNASNGLTISLASSNVVLGNFIGTDATGRAAVGNSSLGIYLSDASDNTIGGAEAAARNLVSGNLNDGVSIQGQDSSGNVVQGNFIGTDVDGLLAIGNLSGLHVGGLAHDNTIGGAGAGEGNLISGNSNSGISLGTTAGNRVEGNAIGIAADGTTPLSNRDGIVAGGDASGNTVVGNTVAGNINAGILWLGGSGNAIRESTVFSNGADGIQIWSSGNSVLDNTIRDNARNGVALLGSDTTVTGNTIVWNGLSGILVDRVIGAQPGSRNTLRLNMILDNLGLGIDLGGDGYGNGDGVTPNDPGDADTGANDLINDPVLIGARPISLTETRIHGTYDGVPNSTVTIDFYASPTGDPSGHGQAATHLGSTVLTLDRNGYASYSVNVLAIVPLGHVVTATATNAAGSTSEFSTNATVAIPLRVSSIFVNDGSAQRSMVTSLTITFNGTVAIGTGAFRIEKSGGGSLIPNVATSVDGHGRTVAVLTFSGAFVEYGSLIDGSYTLKINGLSITGPGGVPIDADGDGFAGGVSTYQFRRLFGDFIADGTVGTADYLAFRTAYLRPPQTPPAELAALTAAFDFNGDGIVDKADLDAFNKRFVIKK